MAISTMYLSAILLLLVSATKASSEDREEILHTSEHKRELCGGFCSFRICRPNLNNNLRSVGQTTDLRVPGIPGYGNICKPSRAVGLILRTGEPMIRVAPETYTPLASWAPVGLSPQFPSRYFGARRSTLKAFRTTRSGIYRKASTGNQYEYLQGSCIVLPIVKWKEINPDTKAFVGIAKSSKGETTDCVSFKISTPKMRIQATWINDGDVDMSVKQPNDDVLSRASPNTRYGSFYRDTGKDQCGLRDFNQEKVIYTSQAPKGTYTIKLVMGKKCKAKKFRWIVTVQLDGNVVLKESKVTRAKRFATITTLNFTI